MYMYVVYQNVLIKINDWSFCQNLKFCTSTHLIIQRQIISTSRSKIQYFYEN